MSHTVIVTMYRGMTCIILLQVNFVFEGAIDSGGPRREFFRLFSMVASEKFLIGETNQKFFCVDICALQVCMQPDTHVY